MSMTHIPNFQVNRSGTEIAMSPLSYEFSYNRTIYLTGEVDDMSVMVLISQIRTLQSTSTEDITLIINSGGGSVTAGKALIDMMKVSPCDIRTECIGIAASMAAVILACGARGKRTIHKHAEVMIHQPLAGIKGQATDISIMCDHLSKVKAEIIDILAEETGNDKSRLSADMERDNWMTAEEALGYGICDTILEGA